MAKATKTSNVEVITQPTDNIVDIDLSVTEKKRFRINGDATKILELNTSDMTIAARLPEAYAKLDKLTKNAQGLAMINIDPNSSEEEQLKGIASFGEQLKTIDQEMRIILDELFDAPVSAICAPTGSLFDIFGGQFRYEHIMETLSKLYHNNFNEEFNRMKIKLQQKTQKYTGKPRKR